jgi:hypothetical protein
MFPTLRLRWPLVGGGGRQPIDTGMGLSCDTNDFEMCGKHQEH